VGDPLPPSLNIPVTISDLRAFQSAGKLKVAFTAPGVTTDRVSMKRLGEVELRIGPESANWATEARRIETGVEQPGAAHLEIPVRDWVGQEVLVRVRVASSKGRFSEWSNTVRLSVLPPLGIPADVKAEGSAAGVRLTWAAPEPRPGLAWRIFRRAPDQEKPELLGTSDHAEYIDATAPYGKTYEYSVQAAMKAGDAEAESEVSKPAAIPFEDRFPPAVPSGLTAIAGLQSIQLVWNPDTEPDLKGYYVYRSVGGEAFTRVGELLESPSYTDRAVEAGKRYRYAVSAVDQLGNESARPAPVEVLAQ
jgi:fibronectin type 3 domain-containing protein